MQNKTIHIKTIPVTVDKSHLIVIGERLYAQSLELIRELVSNAYDADATHVWISLTPYALSVRDNGSGMDEAGLHQFFIIGSPEKRVNKKSPMYNRTRIGEFGIGKFAVLSACDVFNIYTQKGGFAAKLVFDKNLWEALDEWEIPVHTMEPSLARGDGTTVTLENLKKQLTLPDIERFVRERLPLNAPNFNIFLNDKKIEPHMISGKKFPINRMTSFGLIRGEIIIPNLHLKTDQEKGIECYVKDVFIKRETFGYEYSHMLGSNRLTGAIHADFLPITSDRSRFITDTTEYSEFSRVMRQELGGVLKELKDHVNTREENKADSILKDALSHIRRALKKNPEFAPQTKVSVPDNRQSDEGRMADIMKDEESTHENVSQAPEEPKNPEVPAEGMSGQTDEEMKTKKKPDRSTVKVRVRTLKGKEVMARKMQIGIFSVVCRTEDMGENSPPVMWDSGVIFLNRSHPIYIRFSKNTEALTLLITELIAQEIARIRSKTPDEAFSLQNQIMTDAWG